MKKLLKRPLTITNFTKNSTFFIGIQNYKYFIDPLRPKANLLPKKEELLILKNKIEDYKNKINLLSTEKENKKINILDKYKNSLNSYFKPTVNVQSIYATRFIEIINILKQEEIKISLKNIQMIYKEKYKTKISLMTISRILRNKMKYKYRKTSIKNPLLNENRYKFMLGIFIKVILRSIRLGIKLLFIDETGVQLENNNYYSWQRDNEIFLGGAKTNLKKKLNLILAIDDEKVIHKELTYENIESKKMVQFFKELLAKMGDKKSEYLFIMDNATYHLNDELKKLLLNNKIKVLLNCPYYSTFNAIEYEFRSLKCFLYNYLIKDNKELMEKVETFLISKENGRIISKIYLNELEIYHAYAYEHSNDNLDEIYKDI